MRILIGGAGELGCHIASQLAGTADVVLLDSDPAQLRRAEDRLDVLTLAGDMRHRADLERAEAGRCDVFFAVTRDDAANVVAAAFAKQLGANRSIARVDNPGFLSTEGGIERGVLGVDALVCGSRLLGSELVRRISGIEAQQVLAFGGGSIHVSIVKVSDMSPLVGKRLFGSGKGSHPSVIAAINDGRLLAAQSVDRIESGDTILCVGEPEEVAAATWSLKGGRPGRAYVVGGGLSGRHLARSLASQSWETRLIELDRDSCEELGASLPGVTVVHGDGTQLSFLQNERVELAQVFVSATRNDEVNLMASLLAHQQGVPCALAVTHRPGYAAVYDALGLDGTSSIHDVITHSMRWLLPTEAIVCREPFGDKMFEIAEILIGQAALAKGGLNMRDLPFPARAQAGGIIRDGRVIRDPLLALDPEDHILLLGRRAEIDEFALALRNLGRSRNR